MVIDSKTELAKPVARKIHQKMTARDNKTADWPGHSVKMMIKAS
jgi:hypothetical protein